MISSQVFMISSNNLVVMISFNNRVVMISFSNQVDTTNNSSLVCMIISNNQVDMISIHQSLLVSCLISKLLSNQKHHQLSLIRQKSPPAHPRHSSTPHPCQPYLSKPPGRHP